MPEYLQTPTFVGQSDLLAEVAVEGSWSGLGNFVVSGLLVTPNEPGSDLFRVAKYVGEHSVPGDIARLRRSVHEVMRRMGQPVIVKHMWNDLDVGRGLAKRSANFQDAYGQVRNADPHSHGIGFVSVENSTDEWIAPDGDIVTADTQPANTYIPAPKYRGFGPGFLTYLIEPDVAEDFFKLDTAGALHKLQQQTVQAPWFPEINDNDLIINITLNARGNVIALGDRYTAKMTNPISIRGLDRRGRQEYSGDNGNRHVVNQNFEMSRIPEGNILHNVETDR